MSPFGVLFTAELSFFAGFGDDADNRYLGLLHFSRSLNRLERIHSPQQQCKWKSRYLHLARNRPQSLRAARALERGKETNNTWLFSPLGYQYDSSNLTIFPLGGT